MIKDIRNFFRIYNPTLFIISGDIAYSPDIDNVYASLYSKIIEPLSSHFGLPKNRFVVTPGNHDISFKYAKSRTIDYKRLQDIRTKLTEFEADEEAYRPYASSGAKVPAAIFSPSLSRGETGASVTMCLRNNNGFAGGTSCTGRAEAGKGGGGAGRENAAAALSLTARR
jgi:hypothetical protein